MTLLVPLLLSAASPALQDHSGIHAPEASLFLQVPNAQDLVAAYKASAYANLLNDEELMAAIGEVMGQPDFDPIELFMQEWEAAEQNGDIPALRPMLSSLRGVSLSFSLKDNDLLGFIEAASASDDEADLVPWMGAELLVEFSDSEAAAAALAMVWDMAGGQPDELQETQVAGPGGEVTLWTVSDPSPMAQSLRFVHSGQHVLMRVGGIGLNTFMQRLGGTGPAIAARMGGEAEALGPRMGLTLMEVVNRLGDQPLRALEEQLDLEGGSGLMASLLEAVGGPGYTMMLRGGSWRISAQDGKFVTQGVHSESKISTLDGVVGSKNLSREGMALVHPEAVAGGIVSLESGRLAAWLTESMDSENSTELAEIQEAFGFHPIDDLLRPLGSTAAWSLAGSVGLSAPPFHFTADLTDAEAFRRGVAGLARMIPAMESGVEVSSRPYRGFDVTTFKFDSSGMDMGDLPINPLDLFQPTVVVLDDRVLVTVNARLAKREIKRVLKGETALHPVLESTNLPAGGVTEFGFANWIDVIGDLYRAGRSMAPMLAGSMGEEMPFDLAALPEADLFLRHFDNSFEWRRRAAGQVHYYGESSFGPEWNGMALASLVAVFGAVQAVPVVSAQLEVAQDGVAQADIQAIRQGVIQFQINNGGRLPSDLAMLFHADANGNSYLLGDLAQDPWGQPYRYWQADDGSQFAVWSSGPNGIDEQGEGDDIILP